MFFVASDQSLTPHIALDGYWEEWITNIFLDLIKPGMKVIDVGANVGYYTLLAADAVGPNGFVTALEANPELANIIYRNLSINGLDTRSEVLCKAVFSERTEVNFSIYKNFKGSPGLWGTSEQAATYRDQVEVIRVEAIPLNEQFSGQRVDFIKIDAEGAEGHILKGASKLIEANPHLQMLIEYSPFHIQACFGSISDFHAMLEQYNFEPFVAQHDSTLTGMTFSELANSGITHCDIVLKRKI